MGDEINRLAVFESESQRKDGVIAQLRDEMEAMATDLRQVKPSAGGDASHTAALQTRVKELEADIHMKQLEINALKDQVKLVLGRLTDQNCTKFANRLTENNI